MAHQSWNARLPTLQTIFCSERCHCALPSWGPISELLVNLFISLLTRQSWNACLPSLRTLHISLSNARRLGSAIVGCLGDCCCGCQSPRHSLLQKNCIKKVMQGRRPRGHHQPLFLFATAQTKQHTADDHPDWSETHTNFVRLSSVLPPIAVIHFQFPSVRAEAKTNSVSSSALSQNLIVATALYHREANSNQMLRSEARAVVLCGSSASKGYRRIHDNIREQELRFILVINL